MPSPTPTPRPRGPTASVSLDASVLGLARSLELVSLWRWTWLSLLVGAVVGLAACVFYQALELAQDHVLYGLAGYHPPLPAGEGHSAADAISTPRPWLLALLPAAGGLLTGLVIWRLAPEAGGHGTDAMIDAYHNRGAQIPLRVPIVTAIASVFTIGSGGSAGREGPISSIGAGFGSTLARVANLSERERRLLLLAGAAAGVSALFRTPLGAALWALEVLYREDFESEGLFPSLVASVTSYSIFISFFGTGHLFGTEAHYDFRPLQLPLYGLLAVTLAALGVLWIKVLHAGEKQLFSRLPLPRWLTPAVGGLALGLLALAIPECLGIGYGWVQDALYPVGSDARLLPDGWDGALALFGIALAKMVATTLTVGSGGSGGVFAPSIVLGGLYGGAFGMAAHQLAPELAPQPGAFVLVGMAAFYGGIGHVPLASLVIVCELAGSYDLLVPLMFAVMITYVLLRRSSLYTRQVKTPRESPAHAGDYTLDLLEDLTVEQAYERGSGARALRADLRLGDFLEELAATTESIFPVVDAGGKLVGMLALSDLRAVLDDEHALDVLLVSDAMQPAFTVAPSATLRSAAATLTASGRDRILVVDPAVPSGTPGAVLGTLSMQAIVAAYDRELMRRKTGARPRAHTHA